MQPRRRRLFLLLMLLLLLKHLALPHPSSRHRLRRLRSPVVVLAWTLRPALHSRHRLLRRATRTRRLPLHATMLRRSPAVVRVPQAVWLNRLPYPLAAAPAWMPPRQQRSLPLLLPPPCLVRRSPRQRSLSTNLLSLCLQT
jgi:hypothetical protein